MTIPSSLHKRMVDAFRHEYEAEFGPGEDVVAYTREELVNKYARDLLFWESRLPKIDATTRPSIETVCAHAIASNAITKMRQLCKDRAIEDAVENRAQVLRAAS